MSVATRRTYKLTSAHALKATVAAGVSVFMLAGAIQCAHAASASSADVAGHVHFDAMPAFKLVVGAKGSPDPYTPRVLNIPAGKKVAVDVTDNIGGCALVTVFPNLRPDGGTVRASVPVGQTRRVVLLAAKPGRYRYHCSENMFFGEIVAQ